MTTWTTTTETEYTTLYMDTDGRLMLVALRESGDGTRNTEDATKNWYDTVAIIGTDEDELRTWAQQWRRHKEGPAPAAITTTSMMTDAEFFDAHGLMADTLFRRRDLDESIERDRNAMRSAG